MTKTQQLLRALIALPSVNPAYAPPASPWAGEQRMADSVAALLARQGLSVELSEVSPGRPNLLARLAPREAARQRVVLAPHLDTVGGDELPGKLFTPRLIRGRLHGRGACDTKGSMAAMLTALCEVAQSRRRPAHTEIVFAGLVDEEYVQAGSRALAASGFRADLAIVGEPTRLKVVTAHKGVLWLHLTTHGKEAHGARPELGRNAVTEMARVVTVLSGEYAASLKRKSHPLLGCPTVNVGSICGGTQPNIVPAQCMISLDRRWLPGESEAQLMRELRALLRRRGLTASIQRIRDATCEPLATDPRQPLVGRFLGCAGQSAPASVDFFSDAGVFSAARTPSVLFGPGDIAQAHTPDEWIEIDQVEQAKNLLRRFLETLP